MPWNTACIAVTNRPHFLWVIYENHAISSATSTITQKRGSRINYPPIKIIGLFLCCAILNMPACWGFFRCTAAAMMDSTSSFDEPLRRASRRDTSEAPKRHTFKFPEGGKQIKDWASVSVSCGLLTPKRTISCTSCRRMDFGSYTMLCFKAAYYGLWNDTYNGYDVVMLTMNGAKDYIEARIRFAW